MGRKSSAKQNSKKNSSKEPGGKFFSQKKKELFVLVERLLKLTSVIESSVNVGKLWEKHLEVESILKEVRNIEASIYSKNKPAPRQTNIDRYLEWLSENGAQYEGVEISEFEGYDLGLKATKEFTEGSLVLTVPRKVMMTENNAQESSLAPFIAVEPLLQHMPNLVLALFLLLEKNNPDSFWKPYIDMLPEKYSTILYFTSDELSELRPSPVFESSLSLYTSIARQYAYFYNKIHTLDIPVMKELQEIFTYENWRWAASTVMTRENNIQQAIGFIPLWDMCNHEHGKITTDFNEELGRAECYALRDFKSNEQIFIFYGARGNADLFLHSGFVYPNNQHDSVKLFLGISSSDPHRRAKLSLLSKLGLYDSDFSLYRRDCPVSPELLAFIRIFNMDQDELTKWSDKGEPDTNPYLDVSRNIPSDLVSSDPVSAAIVGAAIDRKAYMYLKTRCQLLVATYKKTGDSEPDTLHRRNVKLLKECEVQILNGTIKYLEDALQNLPKEAVDETK